MKTTAVKMKFVNLMLFVIIGGALFSVLPAMFKASQAVQINLPSSSDSQYEKINWTSLSPELEQNVFMSTKHEESNRVIQALYAATVDGKKIQKKGDGNSNGSIRMFVGFQGTRASVAFLHVVGAYMDFLTLSGTLANAGFACIPGHCLGLGEGAFLDTQSANWTAAWTMTDNIGHGAMPESQFLTVGEGWDRWAMIQAKYSLYTEVTEIMLP